MNNDQGANTERNGGFNSLITFRTWKWVAVTCSYYVLLHLAPREILKSSPFDIVWGFLIVQTIVTLYLGWKSREPILVDVFLAGMLYAIVFDRLHPTPPAIQSFMGYGVRVLSYAIIVSLGVIGAIVGRIVQIRFFGPVVESSPT